MDVNRVLVVGAGTMGSQIALLCARGGFDVGCQDIDPAMLEKARASLKERSERDIGSGRITQERNTEAWNRLQFGLDLTEFAANTDFVIEAVAERIDVKRNLFTELDRLTPRHTILASNSSSFVPSKLADATNRPDKVCNLHFFSPALVMKCVEVVAGPATSRATVDATVTLAQRLKKTPVVLDRYRYRVPHQAGPPSRNRQPGMSTTRPVAS